ncbi:MAG: cytochrome c-type biogenesis protein CcmH [Anaerolineaceae bacterium]|nr:MAG: cytochrome c-type biogenesis protein CcmH [Anaerolineaceae bacterium]
MKHTLRFTFFVLLLVLAGLLANPVSAQDGQPPTDDDVNQVAKELYCPVCENVPLDVCATQACAQWRDLIRLKLSQGETESQIKQYFVENYGARVLNEPPREGLNWLAYLVPPVIILIGAGFLVRALRMMKKPVVAAPVKGPSVEAPADDYVARLEEEVKKQK